MKKEYLYAGITILFWSTSSTVSKLLLGSFNSMQILMITSLFACVFLFFQNLIKGNLKELKKYKLNDYVYITMLGILGMFLYNLFLYMGINSMQASQAFIINYLWPIMTILFACLILKEKMTSRKIIAVILSFLGVVMVTFNGNFNVETSSLIGAGCCVLAAVSYGLFSVLNKKKSYNNYISMMLFYFVSFIISLAYIIIFKDWFVLKGVELIGLLWSGIFTSAIAYTFWAIALEKGDTAKISNLAYITPFLSLVWTSLILKEEFSLYSLLGLVVIVVGIFIQMKDEKVKK